MYYLKHFTGHIFILLDIFYCTGKILYYNGSIVLILEKKLFGYWKKKSFYRKKKIILPGI